MLLFVDFVMRFGNVLVWFVLGVLFWFGFVMIRSDVFGY